jgi:predicted DNA-binding transcriptional regulator AlpA
MECQMTKLLTLEEVAALLRRSPAAVRYMRTKGTGPKSAKVAGRVMYREADVTAYIEAQFEHST